MFARVVEHGSIRGAARVLALSPSVVSHHVRTLEERVGLALLYRTTRKLVLTPAGERLAGEAHAMVAAAERGLDEARGLSATTGGALRVTLPGFLSETRLARDVAEFAAAHPRVALTLGFSEVPRDLLDDGFDLAIRFGNLEDSTHRTRGLAEMRRVLVAAPGLLAERGRPRAPAELASWPFVHLGSRAPSLRVRHAAREVEVAYQPRVVVDSAIAMRALMLAGAGAATLPELLVRDDVRDGHAVELLPGWQVASVPVQAVWPQATVKAALTLRFLDFLGPRVAALFDGPRRPRRA